MSVTTRYSFLLSIVIASLLSACSQPAKDTGPAPIVSPALPLISAPKVEPETSDLQAPVPIQPTHNASETTPSDPLTHLLFLLTQPPSSDFSTDFDIWDRLNRLNAQQLKTLTQHQSNQPSLQGWLELLELERQQRLNLSNLQQWEQRHPQHNARYSLLPLMRDTLDSQARIQRIVVLLPDRPTLTLVNRDIENGIRKAHQLQPHNPQLQLIVLHDPLPADQLMHKAQAYQPDWIIGPLTKSDIHALNNHTLPNQILLNRLDTPTQALQLGLPIEDEVEQLLEALHQDSGIILVAASQDRQDQRLLTALTQQAQRRGLTLWTISVDQNYANITPWLENNGHLNASRERIATLQKTLRRKLNAQPRLRQDIQALILLGTLRQAQSLMPALHYHQIHWPVLATSRLLPTHKGESLLEPDLKGIQVLTPPYLTSSIEGPDTPFEALGWDSYQLLANPRLQKTSIQGMTGLLSLSANHQVTRRLTWSILDTPWPATLP